MLIYLPFYPSISPSPFGTRVPPGHWITGPKDANAGAAVLVARLTDPEAAGTRAKALQKRRLRAEFWGRDPTETAVKKMALQNGKFFC